MNPEDLIRIRDVADAADPLLRTLYADTKGDVPLWPTGVCGVSSLTLAPLLRKAVIGMKFEVVLGAMRTPDGSHHVHAWVATSDTIIDPTFTQFLPSKQRVGAAWAIFDRPSSSYREDLVVDEDLERELYDSIVTHDANGGDWVGSSDVKLMFMMLNQD